MADEHVYQWSAAMRRPDGRLVLVGVAYAEDEYPDAKELVLSHFYAWKRDAETVGEPSTAVLLRRPIVPWEITDVD